MPLSLTNVRYYTQADPYYYTIDNRPLTDLATRDTELAAEIEKRTYTMRVTGSATPAIVAGPAGWTITLNGTGDYTITHNLGSTAFTALISLVATPGFAIIHSQTSTQVRVNLFNTAGAAQHAEFTLLVSKYA